MADTVTHVALSHPEVSIKFIREGKLQYVTPGDGQLRARPTLCWAGSSAGTLWK